MLWLVATAAAAALAYRELVSVTPRTTLSGELEAWLMLPSQTSSSVVVLLAGWLLYRRRRWLAALDATPGSAWLTALLFGLGAASFAWATYTGADDLLAVSLMANCLGIGNLFWGRPGLRVLSVPVAFLILALPVPGPLLNAVVFRFQLWTAELAGLLLYLIGLPAYVSGDQILREGGSFTIVEGCSGMRSAETLIMLAVLMADLFRRRGWHAALLLLAATPIAFLLNAFRVVSLIVNPLAGTSFVHNAQGIAILLGGVLLLFGLDGLLARTLRSRPRPALPASGRARLGRVRALGATAVFGVAALMAQWLPHWKPPAAGLPTLNGLPAQVGGWVASELETNRVFLGRTGFADTLERRYRSGAEAVDLFVGLGDHDRSRSGYSPKTLQPGSGWIVEEAGRAALAPIGREVDFRILRSGTRRVLVYHWREGTLGLVGESLRALLALDQSPLRRSRHARIIRVTTEVGAASARNRRAAQERLERFLETLWPALEPLGEQKETFSSFSGIVKTFSQGRDREEIDILNGIKDLEAIRRSARALHTTLARD